MTAVVRDDDHPLGPLVNPGRIGGLSDVFRRRYLLKLLVRKELRVRYAASSVGLLWSYVKPAVRFLMYWQVIELLLPKALENRPLHIFAGMIMVSFMTDCLTSGTKSVLKNKALVRKINLPREMFPVASVLVSMYHMIPMYVIAIFGCIVAGWTAEPGAFAAAGLAFLIAVVWGLATALFLSAWNVYYRDIANITEVIQTVITWTVPMIYPFSAIQDSLSGVAEQIYLASPLCIAVLLNDRAFWLPTLDEPNAAATELPPDLWERGVIALLVGMIFLWIAQRVFSRLEGGFAEQL
ncbi:MAG: ABC transporter permease [Nocardioidaceae bacterium]